MRVYSVNVNDQILWLKDHILWVNDYILHPPTHTISVRPSVRLAQYAQEQSIFIFLGQRAIIEHLEN